MATLFELKDEILKGRRVKRRHWKEYFQVVLAPGSVYICNPDTCGDDFFEDDWELEGLPKVKKKIKLYAYVQNMSPGQLVFDQDSKGISDFIRVPNLDQEIEVEE